MSTSDRIAGRRIVITGAGSGIGRCTALACARHGADLALVGRNRDALRTLSEEIRPLGVRTSIHAVDVADAGALRDAADWIASDFGGIDVWINNAATSVYGDFDRIPAEEYRRVLEVNFLGQVHGTLAAMPHLEASERGGRLVGVLSVLAEMPTPLQAPYVASKHALRGFYGSVDEELRHRRSDVRVVTILPSSFSTPLFEHAKTYLGVRPDPLPPVYDPERVALAILRRIARPSFRTVVGGFGRIGSALAQLSPALVRRQQSRSAFRQQRSDDPKGPEDGDNLYRPMSGTDRVGGAMPVTHAVDALERHWRPILGGVAALGIAALAARLLRRS